MESRGKNNLSNVASLRERAEAPLRARDGDFDRLTREDVLRLVHELEVHQIDLEMQNEDLLRAQRELAASRDRLNDLYDFAPVDYVTLDSAGVVVQANLTAAAMHSVDRASGSPGLSRPIPRIRLICIDAPRRAVQSSAVSW